MNRVTMVILVAIMLMGLVTVAGCECARGDYCVVPVSVPF